MKSNSKPIGTWYNTWINIFICVYDRSDDRGKSVLCCFFSFAVQRCDCRCRCFTLSISHSHVYVRINVDNLFWFHQFSTLETCRNTIATPHQSQNNTHAYTSSDFIEPNTKLLPPINETKKKCANSNNNTWK